MTVSTAAGSTAWWIAVRYLRTRRREFASFITRVSVAGLGLGVLVLTVVVSVMNGFDTELRQRILGTVPHVLLPGRLASEPGVAALAGDPQVRALYNFFAGAGMVTTGGSVSPITLYGIDAGAVPHMDTIVQGLRSGALGDLLAGHRGMLLGAPLALHLGLRPGDSLALVISEPDEQGVRPRLLRFNLVGTFELGAELDYSLAVIAIDALGPDAARLGQKGVRLELRDPLAAGSFAARVASLHPDWIVQSWTSSYGELFDAVRLEKLMMFLILLMVVAVAAFNIVSGQTMTVTDKRSDIAILRTMGASEGTILRIFMLQGLVIASVGIAAGLAAGVLLARHIGAAVAALESVLGFRLLEGTYCVEVPSVVLPTDLLVIAGISWGLCLFSAWLPARRAARLNPVTGLHG
ncbi:MAG: FtsX-like permease family protein [Pseudomonadales bacterium]